MIDRIRTRVAITEVIKLRDKIYRSSGTLVGAKFTKASKRVQFLLQLFRYMVLIPQDYKQIQTAPYHEALLEGPKNQKLCLFFCHSLVSQT